MNTLTKIVSAEKLLKLLPRLRRGKRKIAWTNGCFDILHWGHISYLEKAKKDGRILIVGLNSDRSVRMIKGSKRPIVPQKARAAVLAGLACVDYVTIFDEATPEKVIKKLKPDILIKGADWKNKEVAGQKSVKKSGGKVEFIKYIPHYSSSEIIQTILEKCKT